MQMLVDFPGEMPLVIGDAIHNLRAALDLTMCDVARAQGKSTAGIKFPFAENAKKLEAIFRDKEIKRLGPDIKKMILDMQPYKFGNISLRALHDLDIDDKHKLILPAGFSLASGGIPNLWSHRDDLQFGIHSTLFAEPVIGPPVLVTLEGFVELTEGIVEAFATVCGLGRDAVAE